MSNITINTTDSDILVDGLGVVKLLPTGEVCIGPITPDGTLHVHTATAGTVAAHSNADTLILENSTSNGLSILVPDVSTSLVMFGSPSSNRGAEISWNYNGNLFAVGTQKAGGEVRINTGNNVEALRIDSSQNVGIGVSTPDGTLHVHTATAGTVTASASADELVVENSASGGISILVPDASSSALVFGSPTSNSGAKLIYQQSTNLLQLGTVQSGGEVAFVSGAFSEALRIDSSQNILKGTTTSRTIDTRILDFQIENNTAVGMSLTRNGANNAGAWLYFAKSRGTVDGSHTIVNNSDDVGSIIWTGADGVVDIPLASIVAKVDGAPGLNDMPGSLVFSTTADGASTVSEAMRIDSSQNVGIGTTVPDVRLHVADTASQVLKIENTTGGTVWSEYQTSSADYFIGYGTQGFLFSPDTSVVDMLIDSAGNVGIGTTAPDGTLHVHTATAGVVTANTASNDLIIENSTNTGISVLSPDTSVGLISFGSPSDNQGSFIKWDYTNTLTTIATSIVGGEVAILSGTATEAMRIDSSQNVGIGIATPDGTLHVHTATAGVVTANVSADDLVIENNTDCGISILTTDAANATFFMGSPSDNIGAFLQWQHSADYFQLGTSKTGAEVAFKSGNGVEAVRIDSSQNVGIGISALKNWASTYTALQLGGNASLLAQTTEASANEMYILQNAYLDGAFKYITTDEASHYRQRNGEHNFRVAASGTPITAGSFVATTEYKIISIGTTDFTLIGAASNTVGVVFTATGVGTGTGTAHATIITWVDALTINNSGVVGIGTTAPQRHLHINGSDSGAVYTAFTNTTTGATSGDGLIVGITGGEDGYIWNFENTDMIFGTNNTTRMIIDNVGNVGIGDPSPSFGTGSGVDLKRAGIATYRGQNSVTTKAFELSIDTHATLQTTGSASDLIFGTVNVERVRIDASGNVGIGETSPDDLLHLKSAFPAIRITDSDNSGVARLLGSNGDLQIVADLNNAIAGSHILFSIDASEAMRIDASGNVGIGTTNPLAKFEIKDAAPSIALAETGVSANNTRWDMNANGEAFNMRVVNDASTVAVNWLTVDRTLNVVDSIKLSGTLVEVTGNIKLSDGGVRDIIGPAFSSLRILATPNASNEGIIFSTDGGTTTEMIIQDGGNVGIGTVAPDGTLHVHTATAGVVTANSWVDDLVIENSTDAGLSILTANTAQCAIALGDVDDPNVCQITYSHSTDSLLINVNAGEAIRIDSSRNVGIGTSSPDGTLHVSTASAGAVTAHISGDDLVVENSTSGGISILVPDATDAQLVLGSPSDNFGAYIRWEYSGDLMTIGTSKTGASTRFLSGNSAEAARFDSSGNFGIGTTTANFGKLTVKQTNDNDEGGIGLVDSGNLVSMRLYSTGSAGVINVANGGTGTLVLNEGGGNVGIGTLSPDQTLHVHKGSAGAISSIGNSVITLENDTNCYLQFLSPAANLNAILFGDVNDADVGGIFYNHSNNAMAFHTNASEAARFTSSGQFIAGATSAAGGTIVSYDTSSNSFWAIGRVSDGTSSISFRNNADSAYNGRLAADDSTVYMQAQGTTFLDSDGSNTNILGTAGVGIAHTDGTLHVHTATAGTVVAHSTADELIVENNTSGGITILTPNTAQSNLYFGSPADNIGAYIRWQQSTGLMIIGTHHTGGDVQFTADAGSTKAKLWSTGDFQFGAITSAVGEVQTSHFDSSGILNQYRSSGASQNMQLFFNNAVQVGSIVTSTTTTTYNITSDYRLKENISSIDEAVEVVKALKPCKYNFKKTPELENTGFIAHELQEVIPQAVTGIRDETDEDGNDVMQMVDYSKVVATLTAALQASLLKNEELEKRIEKLEGK